MLQAITQTRNITYGLSNGEVPNFQKEQKDDSLWGNADLAVNHFRAAASEITSKIKGMFKWEQGRECAPVRILGIGCYSAVLALWKLEGVTGSAYTAFCSLASGYMSAIDCDTKGKLDIGANIFNKATAAAFCALAVTARHFILPWEVGVILDALIIDVGKDAAMKITEKMYFTDSKEHRIKYGSIYKMISNNHQN